MARAVFERNERDAHDRARAAKGDQKAAQALTAKTLLELSGSAVIPTPDAQPPATSVCGVFFGDFVHIYND